MFYSLHQRHGFAGIRFPCGLFNVMCYLLVLDWWHHLLMHSQGCLQALLRDVLCTVVLQALSWLLQRLFLCVEQVFALHFVKSLQYLILAIKLYIRTQLKNWQLNCHYPDYIKVFIYANPLFDHLYFFTWSTLYVDKKIASVSIV